MTRSAGTCVTKFADYQLGLYATADYLAMHGRITGLANLHEHTLIGYEDAVLEVLPLSVLDELVPECAVVEILRGSLQLTANCSRRAVFRKYTGAL